MQRWMLALLLVAPSLGQEQPPPNVLMLISDDQFWGDFGFMGSEEVRTPALDALAKRSLVFPRGYVPTALCRASLATLVTGLYPHEHKITGNDPPKGVQRELMLEHIEAVETLPKLLGKAGYRSLQTGKWWEGDCTCGGFTEGMSHGDPKRGGRHGDEGLKIGRQGLQPALEFLDDCAEDKTPFFLWYAPLLPHTPHNPPERLLQAYQKQSVPPSIAKYRAMCEWFDETCGQLLDHLHERGLGQNTLVVFVVDNGWIQRPNGKGFAPRSKRTAYEGGVRTPILVSFQGRIAPARVDIPVSSVDLPTTILAACGLQPPARWPGLDLRETEKLQRPVFGASFTHDVVELDCPASSLVMRWIIQDPYKLLVPAAPQAPAQLFHLRQDPAEQHPLSDPARTLELRRSLDQWWPAPTPERR